MTDITCCRLLHLLLLPIRNKCEDDYTLQINFFEFFKRFNADILYIYNVYCVLLCEDCHIVLFTI